MKSSSGDTILSGSLARELFVWCFTSSIKLEVPTTDPSNMSSHTNSSVYVAVRVLHPRRQTKRFPNWREFRGTFPFGNSRINTPGDVTTAFPLIDCNGLMSHDGEIYSSFLNHLAGVPEFVKLRRWGWRGFSNLPSRSPTFSSPWYEFPSP